jgi:hypothetical protein
VILSYGMTRKPHSRKGANPVKLPICGLAARMVAKARFAKTSPVRLVSADLVNLRTCYVLYRVEFISTVPQEKAPGPRH